MKQMKLRLESGINVIYRKFERPDARKCTQILLQNFEPLRSRIGEEEWQKQIGDRYGEPNLPRLAEERDYQVITTLDGDVVGVMGFVKYSEKEGEISNLSVDERFQGKGLGKLLVTMGILQKIQEGIVGFYAHAGQQSRTIFMKLGFSEKENMGETALGTTVLPLFANTSTLLQSTTELQAKLDRTTEAAHSELRETATQCLEGVDELIGALRGKIDPSDLRNHPKRQEDLYGATTYLRFYDEARAAQQ
ncbi:MAG: GNAT family N-acetyltransferase [Candidatus Micrarchaeota archaeon]